MLQALRSITTDRNKNPEIVRVMSVVGAAACLLVFLYANAHYALAAGTFYDLDKVGGMMRDFAECFGMLVVAAAGGLAGKTWIETRHRGNDSGNVPRPQDTQEGNFA